MAKLFLALLVAVAFGKDDSTRNKAEELRKLSNSHGGVISLTSSSFVDYVIEQSRPYNLVVLFTTTSEKYKCATCEEIQGYFYQVAYSYKESGGELPSVSESGQKSRATFFGILEYGPDSHAIYQKFGFVSVPNILVTSPRSVLDEGTKFAVHKEDVWEFNMGSEVFAQKVADFVNSRVGKNIEIKTSTIEALASLIYTLVALGLLCYAAYSLRALLLLPFVWWVAGMTVYIICMAGVVYDIIHGVPWIGSNNKGEAEFINSGQRSQYGFEGFLMSFIISLAGISIVGLNMVAKMNNAWNMRLVGTICVTMLLYCLFKVLSVYRVKASWYSPSMQPPGHYIKGPLMRDQGNSF